jgi:biotin operon repressor
VSIEALNWAWQQPCTNPTSKLVLMALADHANSDGECWPAMKRIAELTGVSSRQVSTHITDLERLGLISKGDRRRWQGQLRGWEYRINLRKAETSGSQLPVASGSTASSPAEAGFRSEPLENHQKERSGRGALNKAVSELREAGATVDQVAARASAYRKAYPNASCTPMALTKHWASLSGEAKTKSVWDGYQQPGEW